MIRFIIHSPITMVVIRITRVNTLHRELIIINVRTEGRYMRFDRESLISTVDMSIWSLSFRTNARRRTNVREPEEGGLPLSPTLI